MQETIESLEEKREHLYDLLVLQKCISYSINRIRAAGCSKVTTQVAPPLSHRRLASRIHLSRF